MLAFKQDPYHQTFYGLAECSRDLPCDSSELTHFRKRFGKGGMERLFRMSVALQGKAALEDNVHIDTTVQEKNITYPTDGKLAIKIINRLNKLAKAHGIREGRTYTKEAKGLRLALRHFRHTKQTPTQSQEGAEAATNNRPRPDPGVAPRLAQVQPVRGPPEGFPVLRVRIGAKPQGQ